MSNMLSLAVPLLLVMSSGERPRVDEGAILVTIALPAGASYISNERMVLSCQFRSQTKSRQAFLLPERGSGNPRLVGVRLWDAEGHMLTGPGDGWWSSRMLSSQRYRETRGDRVTLSGGALLEVPLDLATILIGSDVLPLRPGQYDVQLTSEAGLSNILRVELRGSASPR